MRSSRSESLSEHSAECAILAHSLAVIGNTYFNKSYDADRASTLALYHDLCEVYTGDLPTPVKYFSSMTKSGYDEVEKKAKEKFISKLPDEMKNTYSDIMSGDASLRTLVKAADKLCAYIKCIEELSNGNNEFRTALKATEKALDAFELEELDYFRRNFLEGFSLTLDEL